MKLSCIIPVFNEADSIEPLVREIVDVVSKRGLTYEIIVVNDGSTDSTQQQLAALHRAYPRIVSVIEFRTNLGKSSAYMAGIDGSTGDVVITLDGDGQDDPQEIPALIRAVAKGSDVVVGWKRNRKDSVIKNSTSTIFNTVTRLTTGVKLHDYNCGLKAFTRAAAAELSIYGELHRYIPVLLASRGFIVSEIRVHHRKRIHGKSKYGPIRFINGFLDLLTVISITKFRARPMHLFGYMGSVFFGIGFLAGLYLSYIKLVYGVPIGNRPLLLLSVMLMIMGVQVAITGLVGEYITQHQQEKNGIPGDVKSRILHD